MTRIESPDKGYSGVGVGGLVFADGIAETDDPGIIAYCQGAGYTVGGKQLNPLAAGPAPAPADPRHVRPVTLGTPLRDAATDPRPGDIAPVGAGTGNPHGPGVVAVGLAGFRPQPETPAAPVEQGGAERPAANATTDAWREYAIRQGADPAEVAELKRDELRARYGGDQQ